MILLDPLKDEAQQAVDELLKEGALSYKLNVHLVHEEEVDFYVIYFRDRPIRSVTVRWKKDQSFKEMVRAVVLRKVSGLDNLTMED